VEVRTYHQYCPIARATEILAMRWTPIIVRNLLLGCETFSELMDGAPGISRTLLSSRLELLERYGVVERVPSSHAAHFDAHTVLWSLCRMTEADDLPGRRLVIRFELSDGDRRRFWVVLCPPASEVCIKPPGYDEDLVVRTSSEWLAKWHMGRISLGKAMHAGLIAVEGPIELVGTLANLGLSRFAGVEPVVG
jgi:DNA-binding HxlR family transcriptional regulator